jgi:hypothetical protein
VKKTAKLTEQQILDLPVRIFHTVLGTIIGHVGKITSTETVLYAPAVLSVLSPVGVSYSPIAFGTGPLTLFRAAIAGESGVSAVIADSYPRYVKQWCAGAYDMAPIIIPAGVDTTEEAAKALRPGLYSPPAPGGTASPVIDTTSGDAPVATKSTPASGW